MSDAVITQGTQVKRGQGDGPPETFTTIGEVMAFSGLGSGTSAEIDVTHFLSEAKEWKTGLPDEGELTLELNFLPNDAQQEGMWNDRASATLRNFKIVAPDGTTFSFAAFVKTFSIGGQKDDAYRATVGLRISGRVTWE